MAIQGQQAIHEDELGVLSTTSDVVEHARFVTIDRERVADVAGDFAGKTFRPPPWDAAIHFSDGTARTANYVLVLDTLNFSFWGEPRWHIQYGGERLDGYRALAAALRRAVEEGVPVLEADYLARLTQPDLEYILRGEGQIPMLGQRLAQLHEVGNALRATHGGWFSKMIEAADRSAVELVRAIVLQFPSFNDVARYRGHEVRFYKRAQICVADLSGTFGGRRWGQFGDLEQLTAFADYKVPQILRHLGILRYDPELATRVDARQPLPPGSAEEVEIRAATTWAVEYLRRALAKRVGRVRAFELDWYLWDLSQRDAAGIPPYHLTRTNFY